MQLLKFTIALIFISALSFANAQFTKMFDFNGAETGCYPYMIALTGDGTWLYGTGNNCGTNSRGTIYKIKYDGTDFTKIHDFNDSVGASTPESGVFFDGTYLYGNCKSGGANNYGTLYKIKPDGSDFTVLREFEGDDDDGGVPHGHMYFDGTYLFGVCTQYGLYFGGTLYKIKPDGTDFTIIKHFGSAGSGNTLYGGVISDGTYLYGMTVGGGTGALGVAYKIKPDGTDYSEIINFTDDPNGAWGYGSFVSDGTYLYGMTNNGGEDNRGTIFRVKPDGSDFLQLHDFANVDGAQPLGSLIIPNDKLYGMAELGGAYGFGTMFQLEKDGTRFELLMEFDGAINGSIPFGTLFFDNGAIFGVTNGGGAFNQGVIFRWGEITSDIVENTNSSIKIFPNPTSGNIHIEMLEKLFTGSVVIQIYDLQGKIIHELIAQSGTNSINIENIADGMYVIKISDGMQSYTRHFMVQGN